VVLKLSSKTFDPELEREGRQPSYPSSILEVLGRGLGRTLLQKGFPKKLYSVLIRLLFLLQINTG
jgi:hypothetical protein